MDRARYEQVQELLSQVMDLRPEEQHAFLDEKCQGDETLRDEICELLDFDTETGFVPNAAGRLFEQSQPGEHSPHAFPRHDILRHLGSGGMGDVFSAHHDSLDRVVALKVIRQNSEAASERLLREARILGMLEHPGIVPVYDLQRDESGRPFFTMKVVTGRTLAEAVRDSRGALVAGTGDELSLARRLEMFRAICDAVAYAHSRGVIHRDLKPANVMIGSFGEVQVMDWGLAKLLGQPEAEWPPDSEHESSPTTPELTADGSVMGTPGYMSPEQARGELEQIDVRTDVFSLGAILYTLLTLHRPFDDVPAGELLGRVKSEPPTPPARRVAADVEAYDAGLAVDAELEAIVLKAMARDPAERYASVVELRDEIDRYRDGHPVRARNYALHQRLVKWVRRHRLAVTAALLSTLLVFLGVGGALWSGWRAREAQLEKTQAPLRRLVEPTVGWIQAAERSVARGDMEAALDHLRPFQQARAEIEDFLTRGALPEHLSAAWRARLARESERIEALRAEALATWVDRAVERSPDRPALQKAFESMTPFVDVAERHRIEIVRVPVQRARRALAEAATRDDGEAVRALEAEAVSALANAIRAQPESRSTAEGVLLLTSYLLSRADDPDHSKDCATFLYRMLPLLAEHRELHAEGLIVVARACVRLERRRPIPTQPRVTPAMLALQCLLHVLEPDGTPRVPLSRALLQEARDLLAAVRLLAPAGSHVAAVRDAGWPSRPTPASFGRVSQVREGTLSTWLLSRDDRRAKDAWLDPPSLQRTNVPLEELPFATAIRGAPRAHNLEHWPGAPEVAVVAQLTSGEGEVLLLTSVGEKVISEVIQRSAKSAPARISRSAGSSRCTTGAASRLEPIRFSRLSASSAPVTTRLARRISVHLEARSSSRQSGVAGKSRMCTEPSPKRSSQTSSAVNTRIGASHVTSRW